MSRKSPLKFGWFLSPEQHKLIGPATVVMLGKILVENIAFSHIRFSTFFLHRLFHKPTLFPTDYFAHTTYLHLNCILHPVSMKIEMSNTSKRLIDTYEYKRQLPKYVWKMNKWTERTFGGLPRDKCGIGRTSNSRSCTVGDGITGRWWLVAGASATEGPDKLERII